MSDEQEPRPSFLDYMKEKDYVDVEFGDHEKVPAVSIVANHTQYGIYVKHSLPITPGLDRELKGADLSDLTDVEVNLTDISEWKGTGRESVQEFVKSIAEEFGIQAYNVGGNLKYHTQIVTKEGADRLVAAVRRFDDYVGPIVSAKKDLKKR